MSSQRHATLVAAASLALTLTPLLGVFTGLGWTVPVLLSVAVVAAAGSLVRAAGRGQGLQTLAMGTALIVLLTAVFGEGTAILLFIPTLDTFALWFLLMGEGVNDIIVLTPPVDAEGGILLLTMLGVGTVAILHDMFVVGLRTPALAGLTLLTMYLVPVSVSPEATAWFWFVLPAAAYLWILADDNLRRVSRFGHRFTGRGQLVGPRFPSPLAATARASGALFIMATLMLLAVIPTNTSGLVDRVAGGYGDGPGGGGVGAVDPWAQLAGELRRPDPIDVARVVTDDPDPGYLRMHVSDRLEPERGFGPRAWDGDDLAALDTLPDPGGEVHTATVDILQMPDQVAPVYGRPTWIDLGDRWGVLPDTGVIGSVDSDLNEAGSYTFTYADPEWDPAVLDAAAPMSRDDPRWSVNTEHPDFPELDAIVDEVTAGAETDHQKVLAVLDHLSPRNGFSYSLETETEAGRTSILEFLQQTRQGYCQQYAGAMAWMLRAADVPARVAIGLSKGRSEDGAWVLSSHNYHAWVEVYFGGAGWVPFDPTPASGVSGAVSFPWEVEPSTGDDTEDEPTAAPEQDPRETAAPVDEPDVDERPGLEEDAAAGGGPAGESPDGFNPAWLALALLAPLPFIPALWRVALRRSRLSRGRLSAATAWDETIDLAADYGVALADSLTPRQAAAVLASAAPEAEAAAGALASAVSHHRYSGRGAAAEALPEAVRDLRTALRRNASAKRRSQAVLWPDSLAARLSARRDRTDRSAALRGRVRLGRRSNTGRSEPVTGRP